MVIGVSCHGTATVMQHKPVYALETHPIHDGALCSMPHPRPAAQRERLPGVNLDILWHLVVYQGDRIVNFSNLSGCEF